MQTYGFNNAFIRGKNDVYYKIKESLLGEFFSLKKWERTLKNVMSKTLKIILSSVNGRSIKLHSLDKTNRKFRWGWFKR